MTPELLPAARRRISHYEILSPLGQGGMGEVYVAVDTTLQRKVALKAVRHDRRLLAEARVRLLREARILSQLDHAGICRVYDYIESDGTDFVVLELIDGRTLGDAFREGLDASLRMRIAEGIAAALAAAHAAGIVHRDLKPDNVMLLPNGDVKVLDFGLARSFEGMPAAEPLQAVVPIQGVHASAETIAPEAAPADPGITRPAALTMEGAIVGTPSYMSPEQARGEPATTASDMYSYGLLLRELYTGRPPYDAGVDLPTLLVRIRNGDTAPLPAGLPRDIANLIERLQALAPARRPTALETVERLRVIRDTPRRRLMYLGAAAACLVALAGGVKYTVDVSRERTAAIAAREDATLRREQAETLIGFMLGDLRAKLQKVGRLELLDDVGARAMAYFAALPEGAITHEELYRRSQAVHQIGEVRLAQGNVAAANEAFLESLRLASTLSQREPGNSRWQVALATSHFYVGDALRLQARFADAKRHFAAYRDIANALVAREPDNPKWRLELAYGYSNVAALLEAEGNLEGARRDLEFSLKLKTQLVTGDPHNRELLESLAGGHNRLGLVMEKLGRASDALAHFKADLALQRRMLAKEPDDAQVRREISDALSFVAAGLQDQGDYAAAMAHTRERLEIVQALAAADPANADWQRQLGRALGATGVLHRRMGNLRAALPALVRARAVLKPLSDRNPALYRRQRDTANAENDLATAYLAGGDASRARAHAEAAVSILERVAEKDGRNGDTLNLLGRACLLAARAEARLGETGRAQALRARAIAVLEPLAGSWQDRRFQATWAEALAAAGRAAEARPIVEALAASGFHSEELEPLRETSARPRSQRGVQ